MAALVLSCGVGRAAPEGTIAARTVRLETPCLAAVHVRVDSALPGGARYTFDGSGATVRAEGDEMATIAIPACGPGILDMRLSPQEGLSIGPSHGTAYTVTGALGALSASLGGGSLDLDTVRATHLGLSGDARVRIGTIDGAMQVSASDRAVLRVDHARANAVSGQFLGHAQADFADARLNAVDLVTAQQAGVTVLGEAQVATLTAHGDSVINVESVTGALLRHGDGNVRVSRYNGMIVDRRDAGLPVPGAPTPPSPPVPPPGGQP